MVDEMHPQNIRAAGVIQLLGGVGPNGNVQATILTQQLAAHFCRRGCCRRRVLSTPLKSAPGWWAARTWRRWSAKFAEVDVAIVGIGELEPSQLLKNSGNYYNEDMLICCLSAAR
jgi:DNA-binding transcriptional regulator LsrR (DeoR family)